ncbi:hypothetical protein K493DRAFT_333739 [Basidiobolus meristosporus CBS 931.73]|uniref:Uncharacterized protein n=1 Tax=Basidiobolus meristosporus CBS 931.73 TaxID=1314790 RepID=A0A1Y1Z3Y4_9FUNG|nr:hypothetical protein K493DRAFT_333739 [Basidiobolus meristosporus CBS 931.73]|eukprot:ORY04916.1 hypothetical protein K493DRAFT_333739 [Basidiobolus meristosporus CBS 931.73]
MKYDSLIPLQLFQRLEKYERLLEECPKEDFVLGKYACWFYKLEEPNIVSLLLAVDELQYDVVREEEAFSETTFDGDYLLSRRQQRALAFLGRTNEALTPSQFQEVFQDYVSADGNSTPIDSVPYKNDFKWLSRCTSNDLFGIIWLVGEVRARWVESATKLSQFQDRPREAIRSLISLSQAKPVWYRRAGWKLQIPEYHGRRIEWWWHCIKSNFNHSK